MPKFFLTFAGCSLLATCITDKNPEQKTDAVFISNSAFTSVLGGLEVSNSFPDGNASGLGSLILLDSFYSQETGEEVPGVPVQPLSAQTIK